MTNDELAALRTLMREEIGASEQRTRVLIREEVNAAVYASEQRVGERLEGMDRRLEGMEGRLEGMDRRLDRLEGGQRELQVQVSNLVGRMDSLEGHVGLLEGGQRDLQFQVSKIEVTLTEFAQSQETFLIRHHQLSAIPKTA